MRDGKVLAQKLLSCAYRTGQRFGAMHLIDVLIGRLTEKVTQFGHDKLSVFGIGRELNEKQWRAVLRQLVAMGHLQSRQRSLWRAEADGDRARRAAGRDRGDGCARRRPAPASAQAATKSRRGDLAPAADAPARRCRSRTCARALRAWRSDIARERGVPAYVVLHDATIDGIVRAWPTTLDELRNVPGIGDKKLEHYGDELLQIVKTR